MNLVTLGISWASCFAFLYRFH